MSVHFLFGKKDPRSPWKDPGDEMITYQDMPPEGKVVRKAVIELQKKSMVIWVGVTKKDGSILGLIAHIMGYKSVSFGEIDPGQDDFTNSKVQSFYEEHGRWPRKEKNLIQMAANPILVDEDKRAFKGLVKELGEDTINLQNLNRAVAALIPILRSY